MNGSQVIKREILAGDGNGRKRATVHCPLFQRELSVEECMFCNHYHGMYVQPSGKAGLCCDWSYNQLELASAAGA